MKIDIDWYLSGNDIFYGPFRIEGLDRIPTFKVYADWKDTHELKIRAFEITRVYKGVGSQELYAKHPDEHEDGYTGGDEHRKILNKLINDNKYYRQMIKSIFTEDFYTRYP